MDRPQVPQKINDAVQQGLAACRHSVAPIDALSQYIDRLHAEGSFREAEIALIEATIRHILVRVVKPSNE